MLASMWLIHNTANAPIYEFPSAWARVIYNIAKLTSMLGHCVFFTTRFLPVKYRKTHQKLSLLPELVHARRKGNLHHSWLLLFFSVTPNDECRAGWWEEWRRLGRGPFIWFHIHPPPTCFPQPSLLCVPMMRGTSPTASRGHRTTPLESWTWVWNRRLINSIL